jgi:hypothetical protein
MQQAVRRIDWRRVAIAAAPFAAIGLAALAIRTPLAAGYPTVAVLLFVWIFADSLMLSFMARRRPEEIEARAALAVLAGAFASAAIALPAAFREALLGLPLLAGLMAAVVAAHLLWGLVRARSRFRSGATLRERAIDALSQLLPERLARFMVAELALLHLALFRWRAAPDVPEGQQGFGYHKHLVPIFSVLLFLQVMEIGVVHLLVSLVSPTAALILFVLSDLALVYLIGLLKSFRLRPVLAGEDGIRVRTGILIDRFVAWEDVAAIRTSFSSEQVKSRSTENAALLAWPNLIVELAVPAERQSPLGRTRRIEAIAFRLDDPAAFLRFASPRLSTR